MTYLKILVIVLALYIPSFANAATQVNVNSIYQNPTDVINYDVVECNPALGIETYYNGYYNNNGTSVDGFSCQVGTYQFGQDVQQNIETYGEGIYTIIESDGTCLDYNDCIANWPIINTFEVKGNVNFLANSIDGDFYEDDLPTFYLTCNLTYEGCLVVVYLDNTLETVTNYYVNTLIDGNNLLGGVAVGGNYTIAVYNSNTYAGGCNINTFDTACMSEAKDFKNFTLYAGNRPLGLDSIVSTGQTAYSSTIGGTIGNDVSYVGTNFIKLWIGSALALLAGLVNWVVALIIISIIVYFAYRAFRFFRT